MPNQNRDQAEQLIAEVLAAACLLAKEERGSAKDRSLVLRVMECTELALRTRQISVHGRAGVGGEVLLPTALVNGSVRSVVMRKRGRQMALDMTRLRSYGALINMAKWCKSALRSNLLKAFKIVGQPEVC